jgi:hypothetical protein
MRVRTIQDIMVESKDGSIEIVPAGTLLETNFGPAVNMAAKYKNLAQLNPGLEMFGDPTDADENIDVVTRDGGKINGIQLADSNLIPKEWRNAAALEGYLPHEIMAFIHDADLIPMRPTQYEQEQRPSREDMLNADADRRMDADIEDRL